MQHVIFARDRRRKKNRIIVILFLVSVIFIFIAVMLSLKINSNNATDEINLSLSVDQINENATSYEDDFLLDDDLDDETIKRIQDEAAIDGAIDSFIDMAEEAIRIQQQFSYTVTDGDTLSNVLEQSGLGGDTAVSLEKQFPELVHLLPGQQFYWVLGKNNELDYMNWLISEKEEKIFERASDGQFSVKTVEKESVWKTEVIKGTIEDSLSTSLSQEGLSSRQIKQLATALQWQISMTKLQKGDQFSILVRREYVNDKVTELGNVEAIHLMSGNKSYYAIQADNGRYYNLHGETLGQVFSRYPLQSRARVSSPFNLRRLHPITRRISPHKGVDFGVPIGTPVIAPADGIIERVAYQANGAGRYITLKHGSQYTTVYMHLSKVLVKAGQNVKKGDRIALSGNTGRSTGPHLHYEFHINGQPVNPMTVKLPGTGSGLPTKERKSFLAKAKQIQTQLKF
ncbi:murein DD-endopeptidase MepM [Otariodibacter oris]|uniref:Murein DD-endopeptidase MepM/ murein hydrolase activator NlpD n=1 Tax=Otariodibacter oris TaxID=1032623 RepID=A0A420XHR8_9PAST|nr:murein DD-endopeptidase MepM [Otariodibacter oris]QGM80926.1 peptidase M23 [Otariodibacter oris]RKR76897.1 murein DD-endopeptidase MepM/ murein hydrolase activator NlpD [Otariodibacter oris]